MSSDDRFHQGPRPAHGLGFRTGQGLNFYSHSLYWLIQYTGPVKVVTEFLKDGEPVLYGTMSNEDLDRLVASGQLTQVRRHAWGISWPFRDQTQGAADDFSNFTAWREHLLQAQGPCPGPVSEYGGEPEEFGRPGW